jgi:hypothetical protein
MADGAKRLVGITDGGLDNEGSADNGEIDRNYGSGTGVG